MLNATFSVIFKLCENFKKSDSNLYDWDMSAETIFRTILLQAFSDVDLKLPNNIIRNCRSIFFFAVKCHIRYIRGHQISQALQESSNCVIISRDFEP